MKNQPIDQAICAFDQANAQDPTVEWSDGQALPRELVKAQRLSAWVEQLVEAPSDALRLAARCQHLERWRVPRSTYPEGRVGYLKWRKDLAKRHADAAGAILEAHGIAPETIAAVRRINLKQDLKGNPDVGVMEDALCLSFLEHEFAAFAQKHDTAKLIDIVQKTWQKMSAAAQERALRLSFSPDVFALIQLALGAPESARR